jgi:acid stress-induced BolA-like protein IbaG/YrbA
MIGNQQNMQFFPELSSVSNLQRRQSLAAGLNSAITGVEIHQMQIAQSGRGM